jgi:muramidase (phage lysozyme)
MSVSKLRSRGALSYVEKGEVETAISFLRKEWTSMPGAAQSKMTLAEARQLFTRYVAELADQ